MELLKTCRDYAHKYYAGLLLASEKSLKDALFERAKQGTSNQEQQLYYLAMQHLEQRSDVMRQAFLNSLQGCYQQFTSAKSSTEDALSIHAETLSLVQREELEDDLAVSVIASKANSRNSEELWKLNKRLAVLRAGRAVDDDSNPFGPTAASKALQCAVRELELDSKVRLFVYRHLGKLFVVSFTRVLQELNQLLVDHGILANLRFAVSKTAVPVVAPLSPAARQDEQHSPGNPQESETSINHQRQLFEAIRSLQSKNTGKSITASGVNLGNLVAEGDSASCFGPVDYALALSVVQQSQEFLSSLSTNQPLPTEKVEQRLIRQLDKLAASGEGKKLARDDANTIDLVGMIFRYMLDDPKLPDSVKSLLSHLHTPYLKLALMDQSFLDNFHHSARLLLNGMVDTGSRWVRADDDRSVLPKLKSLVEAVLNGFVDNVDIFDQLLDDYRRFRDSLDKRAAMVEKRNAEAQQGLERLEQAKQQARAALQQRLAEQAVSEPIAACLTQPWADFLSFTLLRHGDKSLSWSAALKVVDSVVSSLGTASASLGIADLEHRYTQLDETVRDGLQTIGYDQEASTALLASLERAQHLLLEQRQQGPSAKPDAAAAPVAAPTPVAPQEVPPAALTEQQQSMVGRLRSIAFGTWFEFRDSDPARELKLAWFSRVSANYMFVDQAGVKQRLENESRLACAMCDGVVRVVDKARKSFMERALEAVLATLKLAT